MEGSETNIPSSVKVEQYPNECPLPQMVASHCDIFNSKFLRETSDSNIPTSVVKDEQAPNEFLLPDNNTNGLTTVKVKDEVEKNDLENEDYYEDDDIVGIPQQLCETRIEIQENDEDQFHCPVCGKGFKLKKYLAIHYKIHSSPKKHECKFCGKLFLTFKELRLHLRTHTGEKPHQCPECEKCFAQFGHLRDHIKRLHRADRDFQCTYCEKRYLTVKELGDHIISHTGQRPHHCLECGKAFVRPTHLTVHIQRVHMHIKKFECELCAKKCFSRSELKGHLRIHTGEKPYQCNECKKDFTNSSHLKRHFDQTHLNPDKPPNYCEKCSRSFSHSANYRRHAKSCMTDGIEAEVYYQCSQCQQCLSNMSDLRQHIIQDHKELGQTFQCSECTKIYVNLWNLDRHFKKNHNTKTLVL